MKIIHTADWHLGQKFMSKSREEEHAHFLMWLTTTIEKEGVEVLIISGDVYDTSYPPSSASTQYFQFINGLKETTCRYVIVVGGNHDSVQFLHQTKDILARLNVFVIGGGAPNMEEDVISIYSKEGTLELVVCAIPFLRDRELYRKPEDTTAHSVERIKEGIQAYYEEMAQIAHSYKTQGIPVIATGHLYARGASVGEKEDEGEGEAEREIYMGNLGKFDASFFPSLFDYIALGHIHKTQIIGNNPFIRYSGSPIPLSFSESTYKHSILLLTINDGILKEDGIQRIEVPLVRRLVRWKKSLSEIRKLAEERHPLDKGTLKTWVEVKVPKDDFSPTLSAEVNELFKDHPNYEVLKVLSERASSLKLDELISQIDLKAKDAPMEVFEKLCISKNISEEDLPSMIACFQELLDDYESKE